MSAQPHAGAGDTPSMSTTRRPRGMWLLTIGLALVAISLFGHGWGTESGGRWLGLRDGITVDGRRFAYEPSAGARGFVDAASFAFWVGIGALTCGVLALGVAIGGGTRPGLTWPAQVCCWLTGLYGIAAFAVESELAGFGTVTGASAPCAVFGGMAVLVGCRAVTSARPQAPR